MRSLTPQPLNQHVSDLCNENIFIHVDSAVFYIAHNENIVILSRKVASHGYSGLVITFQSPKRKPYGVKSIHIAGRIP